MADEGSLDFRQKRLGAAIAAAKARLEARQGGEGIGIGGLLSTMNDELDQIAHEDHDAAHREYDKIEARLAAERIRLEDDAEDEDA